MALISRGRDLNKDFLTVKLINWDSLLMEIKRSAPFWAGEDRGRRLRGWGEASTDSSRSVKVGMEP